MDASDDDMSFPEDFLTDSPVHISKLSDKEFRRNRELLLRRVIKNQSFEYNNYWNQEMADQYMMTVNRRAGYSLPLPEPVDLSNLERKDLLAIFSKMHSRSFARSMRLCKDVNKLLAKNQTKFSIRIREAVIHVSDPHDQSELNVRRGDRTNRWIIIRDPFSILPFTFLKFLARWDGKSFRDVFDQMKWPVLYRGVELCNDTRLHPKPWMTGLDYLLLQTRKDLTEVLLANWKLINDLKPKELWFSVDDTTISVHDILDSAPRVSIGQIPRNGVLDRLHKHYRVSTLVTEWRSGKWNHRATFIDGCCVELKEHFEKSVEGCFVFELRKYKMIFVPSPDNTYLVLQTYWVYEDRVDFKMVLNVRLVSDLLPHIDILLKDIEPYPVDYSAYSSDLDSVIDPEAFCDLFVNFDDPV